MTTSSAGGDEVWRRPPEGEPAVPATPAAPAPPVYTGPPAMAPPPPGWRPPVRVEPPPPRELPAQDGRLMDAQEQSARALTMGVAMVTGAIALVMLLIICGRLVF